MSLSHTRPSCMSLSSSASSILEHLLGSPCRDMQCHTSQWLLHRSILGHTCFSCSGSICCVWVQKVLPLSASWLPPICHWQVVSHNQWQLGRLAEPCVPAYTEPTDAGVGEGVIGRHLQLVEGNPCLLWGSQRDGVAVHLDYHQPGFPQGHHTCTAAEGLSGF